MTNVTKFPETAWHEAILAMAQAEAAIVTMWCCALALLGKDAAIHYTIARDGLNRVIEAKMRMAAQAAPSQPYGELDDSEFPF